MTDSLPLFDERPSTGLSLAGTLSRKVSESKAQRRFRQLIAKIERQRQVLAQWQAYQMRYNERLTSELLPLQEKLRAGRKAMAALLDEWLAKPKRDSGLSRRHRATLRSMLMNLLEGLLEEGADPDLENLFGKYQTPADVESQKLEVELTHSLLTDVFGLDIDENHGAANPEELMQYAQRQMHERAEQARRAEESRQAHSARRPKGAKAQAAQAQREQAAKEVSQSLREVFRKLASALHPDREPDPKERERKNELMQRVNAAYQADDLLTLLNLQLEIEQIDAAHLATLTPQRLAHYNQILGDQLMELEAELARFQQPFRMLMERWSARLTTEDVDCRLSADVQQLRAATRELEADLIAFRDPERLRQSLDEQEWEEEDPFEDLDEISALIGSLQPPRRNGGPRRRRR